MGNRHHGTPGLYIGRPSPLGNPFRRGQDGTLPEVLFKYAWYLAGELLDPASAVAREIARLAQVARQIAPAPLTVLCSCAPRACHAEIARDVIRLDVGQAPAWDPTRGTPVQSPQGSLFVDAAPAEAAAWPACLALWHALVPHATADVPPLALFLAYRGWLRGTARPEVAAEDWPSLEALAPATVAEFLCRVEDRGVPLGRVE